MPRLSTLLQEQEREEHWVSISDMMTGLMMIFLFISVLYMLHMRADKEKIEEIAVTYSEMQDALYEDLDREFRSDLPKWNAVLDKPTLSIRFEEPEVLFEPGRVEVRPAFRTILDDFFPRYVRILMLPRYLRDIEEVRIEGHTSSEWLSEPNLDTAYRKNMELSQGRTRSVLSYALLLPDIARMLGTKKWLKKHLTANGLSSSKLRLNPDGTENRRKSRRVEFRVRTNAEKRIVEIIKRKEE
jgi:outer membrane protein OmpA-like peptidoglycan-associated protein